MPLFKISLHHFLEGAQFWHPSMTPSLLISPIVSLPFLLSTEQAVSPRKMPYLYLLALHRLFPLPGMSLFPPF